MSDPFLSEIRLFPYSQVPPNWAMCNGQLMPINTNQALFALLGTQYGGNGTTNFALPDLRGRVAVHFEELVLPIGTSGGAETHTLSIQELPTHTHGWQANPQSASLASPIGNLVAASNNLYANPAALTSLHPQSVTTVGGSQPHTNMQPYLTLTYCIATQGVFPSTS